MPIQIYVEVNGEAVDSYHIARTGSCYGDGEEVEYTVVKGSAYPIHDAVQRGINNKLWEQGTVFVHTPQDGLETCVRKALNALGEVKGVDL